MTVTFPWGTHSLQDCDSQTHRVAQQSSSINTINRTLHIQETLLSIINLHCDNKMATRITTQHVERSIRSQRAVEDQKSILNHFSNEHNKLVSAANSQVKTDIRRQFAREQSLLMEKEYETKLQNEALKQRFDSRTALQNQALATELDKQKSEDERKAREIQRICENSPELKELEQALKIAYLNKERKEQVEQKILIATREQERIQAIEDQMEYDRQKALLADKEKMKLYQQQYTEQRHVLEHQIEEKRQQLLDMERQKDYDKQLVESIVNQINQEDEAEYRKKREMQAAAAIMIKEFEIQRQKEREAKKAQEKADEDAILAYQKASMERNQDITAKKQAKKDEDDRILAKIIEENEIKRKADEEFIMLRDMLWEEELEVKRATEVRNRQEKSLQMKRDMMDANAKMLQLKEEKRIRDAENEARMVEMMRRKFAEDDAKERDVELKRLQARERYMQLIEQQKSDRRSLYNQEREREIAEYEEQERREEYRKKVIQEARKRLIEEHAANLKGYLAPKVLSNPDEMKLFKSASNY